MEISFSEEEKALQSSAIFLPLQQAFTSASLSPPLKEHSNSFRGSCPGE